VLLPSRRRRRKWFSHLREPIAPRKVNNIFLFFFKEEMKKIVILGG